MIEVSIERLQGKFKIMCHDKITKINSEMLTQDLNLLRLSEQNKNNLTIEMEQAVGKLINDLFVQYKNLIRG